MTRKTSKQARASLRVMREMASRRKRIVAMATGRKGKTCVEGKSKGKRMQKKNGQNGETARDGRSVPQGCQPRHFPLFFPPSLFLSLIPIPFFFPDWRRASLASLFFLGGLFGKRHHRRRTAGAGAGSSAWYGRFPKVFGRSYGSSSG